MLPPPSFSLNNDQAREGVSCCADGRDGIAENGRRNRERKGVDPMIACMAMHGDGGRYYQRSFVIW